MKKNKKIPSITDVHYDDSLSHEDVLRSIIVLISHPTNSISGWARLLKSDSKVKLDPDELSEEILENVSGILIVLEKAKEYVKRNKKD